MVPPRPRARTSRDYVAVLRRRFWLIALTTILGVVAAIAYAELRTPEYTATAQVLLQPAQNLSSSSANPQPLTATDVQTQIQLVTSTPVKDAVTYRLGRLPKVVVSPVAGTNVIGIASTATKRAATSVVANTYATAYVAFRQGQTIGTLQSAAAQLQNEINAIDGQIGSLDAQTTPGAPNAGQAQATTASQRSQLVTQETTLKNQLSQVQVNQSLVQSGVQVVTPAQTPSAPSSAGPTRLGLLGLVGGLVLGVGLAYLVDFVDDSIRSHEDVERVVPGLSSLGHIPAVPSWRDRSDAYTVTLREPAGASAEAYRALRTSVQFAGVDRPMSLVQCTSPSSAEGKTTTVANLAVVLAGADERVVVVDGDLRQPRIHAFFDLDSRVGLTSVVRREVSLSDALQEVPDVPGLWLLASGPLPHNPSELLASDRMADVLAALGDQADIVLIDTPPILPVTDAAVISGRVDATLLVVTAGSTRGRRLARAGEILTQIEAPVLGVVINGVRREESYGYEYGYAYGSGGRDQPRARVDKA